MQSMKQTLILLSLTMMSMASHAEVQCPPIEQIKQLRFEHASGASGIWDLIAPPFFQEKQRWQPVFTVYLPEAKTADQALLAGMKFYFLEVAFFNTPLKSERQGQTHCYYAQADNRYFMRASTN